MEYLLKKFLQNEDMKKLYEEARSNEEAHKQINKLFNDFLYKIYFLSYIKKTICLSYKDVYRKKAAQADREACILNDKNGDLETELIECIIDDTFNLEEEVLNSSNSKTLGDYFSDPEIIKIINELTEKQKLVIYKQVIEDKSIQEIADELGVSKQAISKTRLAAIDTLRSNFGGDGYGRAV